MTRNELKNKIAEVDGSDTLWAYIDIYINSKRVAEDRIEMRKQISGYFGSANRNEAKKVFAEIDTYEYKIALQNKANKNTSILTENEKALNAFNERMTSMNEKLELIQNHCIENNMELNPENVHWGHVGNAGHVNELLDEIINFLRIK